MYVYVYVYENVLVCMSMYKYVCLYVCSWMYVCIYLSMSMYKHVCMYVCMNVLNLGCDCDNMPAFNKFLSSSSKPTGKIVERSWTIIKSTIGGCEFEEEEEEEEEVEIHR